MKSNMTEIVFILDRSGSMSGLESDTIGGYNSFLEQQKDVDGEATVTTILFDDRYEMLHDGVDIMAIEPITRDQYYVRGSTALLDAVGRTINSVGARLGRTPESDRPGKVIFVITTDGQENSSDEFTYDMIQKMIIHQREKYSWEFIFLGANIDAAEEARKLGVDPSNATSFIADKVGVACLYESMSKNISQYRNTGKVDEDWSNEIDRNTGRKKRN